MTRTSEMSEQIKLATGGKAEKPIARYRLCNNVHVDRCERGAPQVYWNVLKNQTVVVREEDHERLLQAERERVAELERESVKAADRLHEARGDVHRLTNELEALRQAIREKAREWEARIEVHEAQRRCALYSRYEVLDAKVTIFKGCATELRKLESTAQETGND